MKTIDHAEEMHLVRRLYAREEDAMTHFYQHYKAALYYTIWRIVRHNELAEDILQESMLKFWLTFAAYDTRKGRLFTWALNISRNLAIDRLRELRRTSQHTSSLLESSAAELAAPISFKPEHVGVRELIANMLPDDHCLLDLLYWQGYTQQEAAEELQLPLGTIKSRSRRAIHALAQTLGRGELRSE